MTPRFLVEVVGVGILPLENRCWRGGSALKGGWDWTKSASFFFFSFLAAFFVGFLGSQRNTKDCKNSLLNSFSFNGRPHALSPQ